MHVCFVLSWDVGHVLEARGVEGAPAALPEGARLGDEGFPPRGSGVLFAFSDSSSIQKFQKAANDDGINGTEQRAANGRHNV